MKRLEEEKPGELAGAPPAASEPSRGAAPARILGVLALALVLPGLGHFALGRRGRAAAFSLIVLGSLALGCSLHGNLDRVVPDQPLTVLRTIGAMGVGLPYFGLSYAVGYEGDVRSPGYEYGTAFILTAGLMNLLLVLDVWDIARGRKE